jgi:predicted O-methyltransferase YrrM
MSFKDNGNLFKGDKQLINYIKKFFNLKNIHLIEDDIMNLKHHRKKISKLSLIYIDCDIYDVTKNILEILKDKISKNGLIVFDEGNFNVKRGEGKAAKEFFKNNKKIFKRIKLKKFYQPDLIFKKIK